MKEFQSSITILQIGSSFIVQCTIIQLFLFSIVILRSGYSIYKKRFNQQTDTNNKVTETKQRMHRNTTDWQMKKKIKKKYYI